MASNDERRQKTATLIERWQRQVKVVLIDQKSSKINGRSWSQIYRHTDASLFTVRKELVTLKFEYSK